MKYKKTALVISSSVSVISVLMLGQGATVRFMHTFMAEVGFVLLLLSSVVTWCVAGANSRKDIVQLFEAERGQTRFWKERADSLQDSLDFYRGLDEQRKTSAAMVPKEPISKPSIWAGKGEAPRDHDCVVYPSDYEIAHRIHASGVPREEMPPSLQIFIDEAPKQSRSSSASQ